MANNRFRYRRMMLVKARRGVSGGRHDRRWRGHWRDASLARRFRPLRGVLLPVSMPRLAPWPVPRGGASGIALRWRDGRQRSAYRRVAALLREGGADSRREGGTSERRVMRLEEVSAAQAKEMVAAEIPPELPCGIGDIRYDAR